MRDVSLQIGVDHHASVEHIIGVEQRLEVAHDGVAIHAPFGFDERRHVTSCAMLGFERAVIFAADKLYHRAEEAIEVMRVCVCVESLIDEEVQVAILCMTEHDAIPITKIFKEILQVCHRVCETMNRKGNIFVDANASRRTHRADRWDDAFARFPKRGLRDWIISEYGIMQQTNFLDDALRLFFEPVN